MQLAQKKLDYVPLVEFISEAILSIGGAIGITFFAVVWNSIVFSTIGIMLNGGPVKVNRIQYKNLAEAYEHNRFILIFLIFPLICVVLDYFAISYWINKTTFKWDGLTLKKKIGPLTSPGGSFQLSRSSVSQFYVQKTVSKGSKGGSRISYRVIALRIDGPELEIFNSSRSYQSAKILEQWLEEKMDIEDQQVPDEVV